MADIDRVRVAWLGMPGGPGVSTFFSFDGPTLLPQLRTFFSSLAATIPDDVLLHFESSGDTLEDSTGVLQSAWATTQPADLPGGNGEAYAAPCGIVIDWLTNTIRNGRRLRGKTFIVPAGNGAYNTTGQILPAVRAATQAAADALVAGGGTPSLIVWGRPHPGVLGAGSLVTQAVVSPKVAVLRSRRD